MLADFSNLQTAESRLLAELGRSIEALNQVDWFVEVAPVTSPSPSLPVSAKRHRLLFDHQGLVWPFRASGDALPFDASSVPALLVRHAWQPDQARFPMSQWARVLKPGGLMVAVSANPWHRSTWQVMGKRSWRLPSWPHFLMANTHPAMQLEIHPLAQWWGLIPRLSPVLVLVGRKRCDIAPIRPERRSRLALQQTPAVMAQCRAA